MENTIRKLFRDYNTTDPVEILNQMGVKIHFVNAARDAWFGAAVFDAKEDEYMVLINTYHPAQKQHETYIHELGHILLQHFKIMKKEGSDINIVEREADTFTRIYLQLEREM